MWSVLHLYRTFSARYLSVADIRGPSYREPNCAAHLQIQILGPVINTRRKTSHCVTNRSFNLPRRIARTHHALSVRESRRAIFAAVSTTIATPALSV